MPAITVGIRPENLTLTEAEDSDLVGRVDVVEPLGSATLLHVAFGGGADLRVLVSDFPRDRTGDEIGLRLDRSGIHLFESESGLRIPAA